MAVGTDLATIFATSSFAVYKRRGTRTFDKRMAWTIGAGSAAGVLLGSELLTLLKRVKPIVVFGKTQDTVEYVLLCLFFVLLVFAAWSSAISLIEPAVAWLVENKGLSRIMASVVAGLATWSFGLLTVFSFNIWSEVKLLSRFEVFKDSTVFDLLDYLTANIMLPLGGLLIAIFAAWKMSRASTVDELAMGDRFFYPLWRFLVRYITPVAVIIVFLSAIGIF